MSFFKGLLSKVEKKLEEIKVDTKIEGFVENLRGSKITKESEKIATQVTANIKTEVDNLKKTSLTEIENRLGIDIRQNVDAQLYKKDVNLNAGFELIHLFDCNLLALHINNRKLAEQADICNKKVEALYDACSRRNAELKVLHAHFQTLPAVLTNINNVSKSVEDICVKINEVEALLDEQINKTAQLQIENLAVEKHKELAAYKVQREKELQAYENELSAKKQKVVADRRLRAELLHQQLEVDSEKEKERIRTELEDKIQQDMVDFILWGSKRKTSQPPPQQTTSVLSTSPSTRDESLKQVELAMDDKSSLEDFLNDEETEADAKQPEK
eukprot:TRINITY_DN8370_c0_g1_i1.p1 TRINITY_DN8370_c0_g1~~TRINITY_DN8370_c0_g1_i1.p1  ORF type:complete len:329 (-),score=65.60 TRINITY_DN8370_c0_g1_i1:128-1114(-)